MKRALVIFLSLILCFSILVGCKNTSSGDNKSNLNDTTSTTKCEHDDLERISNLNESTARYKCKNCGEILLTTDPESLPKTYTFSGSFSIAPMNNEANTRVCMGDTILNILNRGSWEKGALASNYDYIFLIGDALLHYDSSKGLFMYTKDATSLITSDTDRVTINYLINSMFVRESIPDLNMATLISLVDIYGENVTWDTFAPYYFEEIGSGLHILRYPIVDANFYLLIGGSSLYTSPMYIRLVSEIDGSYIDIRTDSIREFIGIMHPQSRANG